MLSFADMELVETRGRKPLFKFPDAEIGDTFAYTPTGRDVTPDGTPTKKYISRITSAVTRAAKKRGWKIARRVIGNSVEITRIA